MIDEVGVGLAAEDEVGEDADREPDDDAAGGDADELQRGGAEAEGGAGRDADGDPVEDEGGAVVDHRLAFDQQPHPLGGAEAAEDRGRGDRVGGGEDGAEDRGLGPAQPGHRAWATTATTAAVRKTRPIESSASGRITARSSSGEVRQPAA